MELRTPKRYRVSAQDTHVGGLSVVHPHPHAPVYRRRTASGLWPSDHGGIVARLLLPPPTLAGL